MRRKMVIWYFILFYCTVCNCKVLRHVQARVLLNLGAFGRSLGCIVGVLVSSLDFVIFRPAQVAKWNLLFWPQIFISGLTYIKLVFSESLWHVETGSVYRIEIFWLVLILWSWTLVSFYNVMRPPSHQPQISRRMALYILIKGLLYINYAFL